MVSEVNGPGSSAISSATGSTHKVEQQSDASTPVRLKTGPVTDAVSMTDTARVMQQLDQAISQVPSVDMNRVEGLREAIASGSLEINPRQIAEKMMQFESTHPDDGSKG